MSIRHKPEVLLARDEIVAPPAPRACEDQTFELPGGVYVAMALLFAGFIAVLSLALRDHMAVSFGVIFAFIAAFFAVPTIFPRLGVGASRTRALTWSEFSQKGIVTATGRSSASEATILVLLLPFLILCFGIAVAIIVAVV